MRTGARRRPDTVLRCRIPVSIAHLEAVRRPRRGAVAAVPASARIRPPLKWAGGKRWQLPHLRPIWEAHAPRRLVEPFCGALSVTLGLMPRHALLNDVNPHVVNFFRWLQR